jgi:two-component system NarL family sensor kinase
MRYFSALLLLFALDCTAIAQKTYISHQKDSLQAILKAGKKDTAEAKALVQLGRLYMQSETDSSLYYLRRAETLSRKLNFIPNLVSALDFQSGALSIENKFEEAITKGQQALEIATKTGQPHLISAAYINLSKPYADKGDYRACIEYMLKAMAFVEKTNDSLKLANVYCNLGYYYKCLDEQQTAYEYDLRAAKWSGMVNDKSTLEFSLLNLSGPLIRFGKYDSSILVLKQALRLADELDDKVYSTIMLNNMIVAYRLNGQNEKTLPLVEELIAKAKAFGALEGMALALDNKADYFITGKQYDSAVVYYLKAIDFMKKNNINKYLEVTYKGIMDAKAAKGDFEQYEIYRDLRDSMREALHSDAIIKSTQELNTKYDVEKKDQQIKIQQANLANNRLWILILSISVISAILLFFISQRSHRNKQRIAMQEKELQKQKILQLEKEKQLAATQALLKGQEEERRRLAKDLHDGLGGILSGVKYSFNNMKQHFILSEENARVFERSMGMLDESISELRRVAHNMMPETLMKLTLDEALQDFCQQVTESGAIDVSYQGFGMEGLIADNTIKITAYRIVQELVNNIIKHAEAKKALVQVMAKDDMLKITVEDDGKGFDAGSLHLAAGIGYKNTKSRIEFLNGKLDVQSKRNEGTSVYIEIPL